MATANSNKSEGIIKIDVMEDIIKELPKLSAIHATTHSILIHGMGGKPRSFYRTLDQNKSVELLWTGWSSNVWWTFLLSFIPGQAGLMKVLNRKQLDELYLDIGGQSMCGLYFIPNDKILWVLDKVKKERTPFIGKLLEDEKNYFLLTVDFDFHGGKRDGEVYYCHLLMGEKLDSEINTVFQSMVFDEVQDKL